MADYQFWTEERTEQLTKLWAEGRSASEIALEMGGLSRNAVIGKVHRLQLPERPKRGAPSVKPLVRAPRMPRRRAKVDAYVPPVADPAPAPVAPPSLPAIMPLNKSLLDLEAGECHWPSEGFGPITFCAHQTHGKSSYCLLHYKRSLGPGMKTERNALRNLSGAMA